MEGGFFPLEILQRRVGAFEEYKRDVLLHIGEFFGFTSFIYCGFLEEGGFLAGKLGL